MSKKLIVTISVMLLVIIVVVFLFIIKGVGINPINSNSEYYVYNNTKVYSGFINLTPDQSTAKIIALLTDVNQENGKLIGSLRMGNIGITKIILYSNEIPTALSFQPTREIYSPKNTVSIQKPIVLGSMNDASKTLNKLVGKNIIITLLLKDFTFSHSIMECNRSYIDSLNNRTQPYCTPQTIRISVYQP